MYLLVSRTTLFFSSTQLPNRVYLFTKSTHARMDGILLHGQLVCPIGAVARVSHGGVVLRSGKHGLQRGLFRFGWQVSGFLREDQKGSRKVPSSCDLVAKGMEVNSSNVSVEHYDMSRQRSFIRNQETSRACRSFTECSSQGTEREM